MAVFVEIVSWFLLGAGAAFLLVAGIGIHRLPDVYTRMHATGISDTLATGLIIVGLMLQSGFTLVTVKLAIVLLFLFFTSPTSSHAVSKAALSGGVKPLLKDDLEQTSSKP